MESAPWYQEDAQMGLGNATRCIPATSAAVWVSVLSHFDFPSTGEDASPPSNIFMLTPDVLFLLTTCGCSQQGCVS